MARGRERGGGSRWDEDNRLYVNPWAFIAVAGLVAAIAGLAILLSVLG